MPRQKITQANTESLEVAQQPSAFYKGKDLPFYYEYINKDGVSVLLDNYEWARGLGITDKEVKKAQAARKREVKKGYAYTKEA
jgi:hypothetical protein